MLLVTPHKPREAAQCKHPVALRPGLFPREDKRTKEITKEKNKGKT
jgi:hypothetical protein